MYTGAMKAANAISHLPELSDRFHIETRDAVAEIIDAETHEAGMIAFIERVAAWEYTCVSRAQEEAFALLKKVRG